MRKIDTTEHICKLCGSIQTVGGIRTHIQTKHYGYNTERYVSEFGEFRPKKLSQLKKAESSDIICHECNEKMVSHRNLMYHIRRIHNMSHVEYSVKHRFGGKHPLCKCGCGQKVKILKSGIIDENKNRVYARKFLSGHNTCMQVGVQTRTIESKLKMRQSAINRMERDGKRFSPEISIAQHEIFKFVSDLCDGFSHQDTQILSGREIDIINHEMKIGIEYNGLYFHSDKFKDKKYHISKMKEMENLNYRLIYIWEDWWVRKKEIVKSMLTSILQKNTEKIYARNCEIREISDEESKIFLKKNHIQGGCVSKIRIGLFHNNELVSVMTFGKLRRVLGNVAKDNYWELLRFSSTINTQVVGGASKLFTFFIRQYNPLSVISYANRDWSVGNLYQKLGFQFLGMTEPGYFYAKGKLRFSRSKFTKDKLVKLGADKSKTESVIMDEMNYMKVWDTGNLKYIWNRE